MLKITSHPLPPPTHTHPSPPPLPQMPLSKYLLYCHATVSIRLLVGCRHLEQIVPQMNVQQSHPFRSHLNPNQSCFRKYLCDKAFAKYQGAYHIGSKSKTSEARKGKEQRKKSKNRKLNASSNRRKRSCIIFRSLGVVNLLFILMEYFQQLFNSCSY